MRLFGKNLDSEVAIVAEIGVNHEGDANVASKLLHLAAEAGADAVKFQSYTPECFVSAADEARLQRARKFALDRQAHYRLAREAKELGIDFFSSAISEDMVQLIADLAPAIKIASGDLTFEPVIRAAARTGKPVIVSTGLGTVEEIDQTVSWISDETGATPLADHLVLMQCVSAYPTPIDQANVLGVPYLAERYDVPVGYSNHVVGLEPCYAAIALGASVIEVHFTDRKHGREFRDHELSAEPADLAALVKAAPRIRASLGSRGKQRQACELPYLDLVRKGVVAARDLPAGTTLTRNDLSYARPATGIAACDIDSLVGRRLTIAIGQGMPLQHSDLSS